MRIYIIGAGVMGGAIATTLAKKGHRVFVSDVNVSKVKALTQQKNIFADKNFENLAKTDFVILAVKPHHIVDTAEQIKDILFDQTVIISIAAGTTISKIQKYFGKNKVVRVMPNLGLSIGQGIAAWKSAGLSTVAKRKLKKLLDGFTENFEVSTEQQIDAVTAISGSGPAYFFYFAQSVFKAATKLGIKEAQAKQLVSKTFSAAAVLSNNANYQELINNVASKKGTTQAALDVFHKQRLGNSINQAVQAAYKRAQELSHA